MTSSRASFLWGALGAMSVLIAAAIIVPQYADYKERAANAIMLQEAAPLHQAIETRILALGTIENSGLGLQVPSGPGSGHSYKAIATRDGTLILQGDRYGHILVLSPTLTEGAVTWHCMGGPHKDVPRQCRGE